MNALLPTIREKKRCRTLKEMKREGSLIEKPSGRGQWFVSRELGFLPERWTLFPGSGLEICLFSFRREPTEGKGEEGDCCLVFYFMIRWLVLRMVPGRERGPENEEKEGKGWEKVVALGKRGSRSAVYHSGKEITMAFDVVRLHLLDLQINKSHKRLENLI